MTHATGGESPNKVQHYLHGVAYPAGKRQLLSQAQRNGAPEEVCRILSALKADEFYGPQDVLKAYRRLH